MLEIELIQVALGIRDGLSRVPSQKEWDAIFAFAERHGIMGVLFGGVERLGQLRAAKAESEELRGAKAESEELRGAKAESEELRGAKAESEELRGAKAESEELRGERKSSKSETSSLSSKLDPLSSNLDPLNSKLDPLSSKLDPLSSNLDPLSSNLDPLSSNLDPLSSKLDPLSSNLDPLSSKLDPLSSNLDPLNSKLDPLSSNLDPLSSLSMDMLMDWLGQAEYQKTQYEEQRKAVNSLVALWEAAGLHVVELKGNSIGQYYPRPELRYSCDFDCFLLKTITEKTAFASATLDAAASDTNCASEIVSELPSSAPQSSSAEAKVKNIASLKNNIVSGYEEGNLVVEAQGVTVNREFYKNSSFMWKGLHVENHQFCCPVRGNKRMKRFERTLRNLLKPSETPETSETGLKLPSANFNALFLMEHMWAHFFEEALTMKQVLDWVVLRQKRKDRVDWQLFEQEARRCGFWEFAVAINRIADAILGIESIEGIKSVKERKLWENILSGGGTIEMNNGWSTRFQLIGNYFRNSWKYRYFAPHGALYTLARTSLAYVFDRNPKI